MAELICARGDYFPSYRLCKCLVTDGDVIFPATDFSAKDGCGISQRWDSEGRLKELAPYSSVPCKQRFTSSSWAKLQTAGGWLEHFKTFISRYPVAFLTINTRASIRRHGEHLSQGPFLSQWVLIQSKFSVLISLQQWDSILFLPPPPSSPQPDSPSLPGE